MMVMNTGATTMIGGNDNNHDIDHNDDRNDDNDPTNTTRATSTSTSTTTSTSNPHDDDPHNNNNNNNHNSSSTDSGCYYYSMSAIKMDELLVTHWLGSDTVYTNVLQWIEEHSHPFTASSTTTASSGSNTTDVATTATTRSSSNTDDAGKHNAETTGTTTTTTTSTTTSTTATTTTTTTTSTNNATNAIIPPFYPVGQQMKVKRIISRHSKQPNSTTTDPSSLNNPMTGTDIATATTPNTTTHPMSLYDTSYGDPTANIGNTNTMRMDGTTTTPPSHHSTNNPFYNTFSSWNDDNDDDDNVAVTTTTKSINNNNNTPKCVRDVVQIIYYDTIRPITPHHNNDNNYNDDADDNDNDDPMNNHLPYKILLQQPILSPDTVIPMEHFHRITKDVCHFPSYFNTPFYQKIINVWNYHHHHHHHHPSTTLTTNSTTTVTIQMLEYYWKRYMEPYDDTDRFFYVIKPIPTHIDYIIRDDFLPYIQALLREHPGLEFLSSHGEFQEKYAVTVITRIYYCVNTDHSGRITSRQIRHSDLYPTFQQVDQEDDINKVTRYFSYEHFYVLYCRFWELDQDRDYKITREDLLKYGDHSLSHMIVDRIFDAAPRPFVPSQQQQPPPPLPPMHLNTVTGNSTESSATTTTTTTTAITTVSKINRDYLSYEDFIYFMLSEEDKSNEIAVRYWFQCVDVDGDGKLNNMEMRSFYAVQLHRMSCMGHETVPFEDMLCQMMDMMKPANTNYLVVSDFLQKECRTVSGALFDALFSLNKYMLFEQRDPFHERQKREDEFSTDWDRFACMDYNRLAMEEEAREEEAMEIDWVTVDDEDDDDLVGVSAGVGGGNGGNGSHNSNTNGAHLMGGEPSH